MASKPKFHNGAVTGTQQNDESGVAAAEFLPLLSKFEFDQQSLALAIGKDEGYLSSILAGKQAWIGLNLVDKILYALGVPEQLQQLVIIPGQYESYARQMAYYESLDDDDKPRHTIEQIMKRAEELFAMREMMLSGDPEAMAYCRELAGLV